MLSHAFIAQEEAFALQVSHPSAPAEAALRKLFEEFLEGEEFEEDENGHSRDRELQSDALQSFGYFLLRSDPENTERFADLLRLLPSKRAFA